MKVSGFMLQFKNLGLDKFVTLHCGRKSYNRPLFIKSYLKLLSGFTYQTSSTLTSVFSPFHKIRIFLCTYYPGALVCVCIFVWKFLDYLRSLDELQCCFRVGADSQKCLRIWASKFKKGPIFSKPDFFLFSLLL